MHYMLATGTPANSCMSACILRQLQLLATHYPDSAYMINELYISGQQPATQKKQDPSQGKVAREGDPKNAGPKYTTASAAWENGLVSSRGGYSSPAMAKGPWGQSRGFHSGAVLGYVKDKHERPDRGSDVGGIQDGSSDINTGVLCPPVVNLMLHIPLENRHLIWLARVDCHDVSD